MHAIGFRFKAEFLKKCPQVLRRRGDEGVGDAHPRILDGAVEQLRGQALSPVIGFGVEGVEVRYDPLGVAGGRRDVEGRQAADGNGQVLVPGNPGVEPRQVVEGEEEADVFALQVPAPLGKGRGHFVQELGVHHRDGLAVVNRGAVKSVHGNHFFHWLAFPSHFAVKYYHNKFINQANSENNDVGQAEFNDVVAQKGSNIPVLSRFEANFLSFSTSFTFTLPKNAVVVDFQAAFLTFGQ